MTEFEIFQLVLYTATSGVLLAVVYGIIHSFFGRD